MSFMVCTSNETRKSLAGVLADGSRMFWQAMDEHTSGRRRGNSRTQGHASTGQGAIGRVLTLPPLLGFGTGPERGCPPPPEHPPHKARRFFRGPPPFGGGADWG